MVDADDLLQGFAIAGFSIIALSSIAYFLKLRTKKFSMKKSASMEELSSVDTTDPTQIQVEERYASPQVLATTTSPRMGLSFAGK